MDKASTEDKIKGYEELQNKIKDIEDLEEKFYKLSGTIFASAGFSAILGMHKAAGAFAGLGSIVAIGGLGLTLSRRYSKNLIQTYAKDNPIDDPAVEENGYMEGTGNEAVTSYCEIPEVTPTTEEPDIKFGIIDLGEDGHQKEFYATRLPRTYSDSHTVTLPRIRTSYSGEFSEFNGHFCR